MVWHFGVQNVLKNVWILNHHVNFFRYRVRKWRWNHWCKNKSNPNDDDDSNVVNFYKNGEEIEETILDDTDTMISDNNEDAKDDKEFNIIDKNNCVKSVTPLYLWSKHLPTW